MKRGTAKLTIPIYSSLEEAIYQEYFIKLISKHDHPELQQSSPSDLQQDFQAYLKTNELKFICLKLIQRKFRLGQVNKLSEIHDLFNQITINWTFYLNFLKKPNPKMKKVIDELNLDLKSLHSSIIFDKFDKNNKLDTKKYYNEYKPDDQIQVVEQAIVTPQNEGESPKKKIKPNSSQKVIEESPVKSQFFNQSNSEILHQYQVHLTASQESNKKDIDSNKNSKTKSIFTQFQKDRLEQQQMIQFSINIEGKLRDQFTKDYIEKQINNDPYLFLLQNGEKIDQAKNNGCLIQEWIQYFEIFLNFSEKLYPNPQNLAKLTQDAKNIVEIYKNYQSEPDDNNKWIVNDKKKYDVKTIYQLLELVGESIGVLLPYDLNNYAKNLHTEKIKFDVNQLIWNQRNSNFNSELVDAMIQGFEFLQKILSVLQKLRVVLSHNELNSINIENRIREFLSLYK